MLSLADELSAVELKQAYEALALKLLETSGSERDVEMWAHSVYHAIVDALGGSGGGVAGPLALKRLLAARSSWAHVEAFMRDAGLADLKVAERQACYHLLAKLVVERAQAVARRAGIPLAGKLVANQTQDLAAIFDAAFPGYVGGGLAKFVCLRMISGEGRSE